MIDKSIESHLIFRGYKVLYLSYKLNQNFKSQKNKSIPLDFKVRTESTVDETNNEITVDLFCNIFEEGPEKDNPFHLKVNLRGWFKASSSVEKNELYRYAEINAPAILFPFLRTVVSSVTMAANVPPVILPLVNINRLNEIQKQ
ncbi:protein translocase subunit secB [Moorella thermoacetica]|uniref:Protein translocase subunit secB n=1 Tax=Moorella thermoacetica (strain ATCC 39073 / JCM 9320) TaxID=264732 RepID=Q2RKP2_MOOTA|nr:protein-export chaperone SecB [Moorella thermoacetica]AKX93417.1 protein-export protein SecB [Moorella thermoacetica]AKX96067.1 protein-export protein SecB [Moorella thermoacetica]OIQ55279.1 protein-export protein SecB [Moorella thermoacetica]QCZ99877.1 preprotein translocase subunit SecB [Moorella thermoacetica]TYL07469.1 Protein-export protein SecB [Moorella thermoacetica]